MKKTFKKYFALIAVLLAFAACGNPSDPAMPASVKSGTGLLTLTLDRVSASRTILPTTPKSSDFAWFGLKFSNGNSSITEWRTTAALSDSVELPVGIYDLDVTAYVDSEKVKPAAQGRVSGIVISEGQVTAKAVVLEASINTSGVGTFSWNIEYPQNVASAAMTITPLAASGSSTQTLHFTGGLPADTVVNKSGSRILNSGEYRVVFSLRDSKGQTAELDEILHVYENLTSTFQHLFTASNFHFLQVKKVNFPEDEEEAIVNFDGLSGNDIFLVKVNTSDSEVMADRTGNALPARSRSIIVQAQPSADTPEITRTGYSGAEKFNSNPPPFTRSQQPLRARAIAAGVSVGSTRGFWVETPVESGIWVQKTATLLAQGAYSNIWVIDGMDSSRAQAMAAKFDIVYPAVTNIFGYEFGGGPGSHGGVDGDARIQILFYPIGDSIGGFFHSKDLYEQSQLDSVYGNGKYKTNNAEMFYISTLFSDHFTHSSLAHEFQHLIHFNQKFIKHSEEGKYLSSPTWYNEMLSGMTEDVMADKLGIPLTSANHVVNERMAYFLRYYNYLSINEWASTLNYSSVFAFGAYLLRNFGGVGLLSRIMSNDEVGINSITMALNELYPGLDFDQAFARFGEALIFNNHAQDNVMTFNKNVSSTLGNFSYTIPGFDVWSLSNGSDYGPSVYLLGKAAIKPYSLYIHSDDTWMNKTGSISITVEKPKDPNVLLFLMVK